MRAAPVTLIACGIGSALTAAEGSGWHGTWCHPDWGPALFWEETSLGMGEHRICDWQERTQDPARTEARIFCREIRFDGDTVVEMNHQPHAFTALREGPDSIRVQFDDLDPVTLTRCDP